MSGLLDGVAGDDNLFRAWTVVRSNDLADGVVAESVDRFARTASGRLAKLGQDLRSGDYQPSPLTRIEIPKDDGSTRCLRIPAVADRVVERAVVQVLAPVLDPGFSPWSFAYRPGISIADAVRGLVTLRDEGCNTILRADFRDCFDRLPRGLLLVDLRQALEAENGSDVVSLVASLLGRPERVDGRLVSTTVGAPQGGPLSPLLCNLLLDRFDRAMLGRGWTPIRYADDLAIPTRDRADAMEALEAVREEAANVELDLADEKTDIREFQDGFAFLGEDVNHRYPEALPHELRPLPDQRTLYVGRQGAMVRLQKGQIVVDHRKKVLLSTPMSLVSHLVLFGSVMVSPAIIAEAGRSGWTVVWMSRRGWLHGWLDGPHPARSGLRRLQYQAGDDRQRRLDFSRRFVLGKLSNQRALLARYVRRDSRPVIVGAVQWLGEARQSVLSCPSLEQLLGIEGSAARIYFGAFGQLLPDWCDFTGRTKRPPKDPANAVLSYLYSVLTAEVVHAVLAAGLDPAAGFLHDDRERRPSLALDLIEEFRPAVVDTVCLELFRRGSLNANQFTQDERDGGIMMNTKAKQKVLQAFEDRLLTVFAHVPSGKRVTYRRALFLQAQQVATGIRTGTCDYQAVSWR